MPLAAPVATPAAVSRATPETTSSKDAPSVGMVATKPCLIVQLPVRLMGKPMSSKTHNDGRSELSDCGTRLVRAVNDELPGFVVSLLSIQKWQAAHQVGVGIIDNRCVGTHGRRSFGWSKLALHWRRVQARTSILYTTQDVIRKHHQRYSVPYESSSTGRMLDDVSGQRWPPGSHLDMSLNETPAELARSTQ